MLLVRLNAFVSFASLLLLPSVVQAQTEEKAGIISGSDIGAMVLALFAVLLLIVVLASLLKRFNLKFQGTSGMKVLSSVSLGAKERLVIVDVGGQKLLLGVTQQRIECLKELSSDINLEGKQEQ
ncbi:flagellar biosynthetic protein FliO [Idiomarina sp. HP20-50]|uniref:flagellar biosynthetic protein FliO n=1 Tax=Idiomarina sp. HP20-50 TaxID=3070813 RepID=UPI00294AC94A|nr:flagellar biosynthetic protein FliO [Idiomarina sp. HP20-50]MDV6317308.1 flagellar biosynthetic protein FliO [Idiomarina sp. HP20-50]